MNKPEGVKIIIEHVSDVTIVGSADQKEAMKNLVTIIKGKAKEYGGKIRQKNEFSDGFYLQVVFKSKDAKELFDAEIK